MQLFDTREDVPSINGDFDCYVWRVDTAKRGTVYTAVVLTPDSAETHYFERKSEDVARRDAIAWWDELEAEMAR